MADKNKKDIFEQATLDLEKVTSALKANTQEILRTLAKEEIDSLVKESLDKDYVEEDVAMTKEGFGEDEEETEDEISIDTDSEEEDEENVDVDAVSEPEEGDDLEGDYEVGMDAVASDDLDDEIDMVGATDDEVIAIYKKLTGDDEIEVVDNDDEIILTVNEPGEFVIKKNAGGNIDAIGGEIGGEELGADEFGGEELGGEIGGDEFEGEDEFEVEDDDEVVYEIGGDEFEGEDEFEVEDVDEVVYEIALDEDIIRTAEEDEEEEDDDSEAIEEKIQIGQGKSVGANVNPTATGSIAKDIKGAPANAKNESSSSKMTIEEVAKKYNTLLTEAKKIAVKNKEYKNALVEINSKNDKFKEALLEYRKKLGETVVFNTNLTYVTKLLSEHSTTKDEKHQIINRFDEVSTLKESQRLYKTIVNELSNRQTLSESVDKKINKEITSGASHLNEHTVYVAAETNRIKDLINRVESRKFN